MKISPMRSLFILWLLCSAWMLLVWWLGHHAGANLPAAQRLALDAVAGGSLVDLALWGGMVLTLFLAFYLALAIKIDQGRLSIAVRELARGSSTTPPDMAPEWLGLLDEVRMTTRRQQQELAISRQDLDACVHKLTAFEQGLHAEQSRATEALATANGEALRWRQTLADIQRELAAIPLANAAHTPKEEAKALLEPALGRFSEGMNTLQSALQPLSDLLKAAAAGPVTQEIDSLRRGDPEHDAAPARLVGGAAQLVESLQLLCLNFRLALERLGPGLGDDYPELDTVMQDLEPLCAETKALQEEVRRAQDTLVQRTAPVPMVIAPPPWPMPAHETRLVLTEVSQKTGEELQGLTTVLQKSRDSLEALEGDGRGVDAGAQALVIRRVLERLNQALEQAHG